MFAMNFDITIGTFRLTTLESVVVTCSVENLADTATITLPGAAYNRALEIESKIKEGDAVRIRFGYDAHLQELPVEFEGYVESIATDDGSIKINCEDEIYKFRKDLKNTVLSSVSVKVLLQHVIRELGGFELSCDYDFKYDKFTIYEATGFDVLKKVQEETRANIYLKGKTLHVHPQYAETGKNVICDFAVNIEKSELKYKDARKRKFIATIEGTDAKGKTIKVTKGTPGGDKFTLKLPGVSDKATLERRAEEELKIRAYSGYEGSFTGWLLPHIAPTDIVELRDADYEYKTGKYYVVSVVSTFAAGGGSRKVTIGKKIG
jgi:predicted acetyltransferase|nr:MAG TPA: tail protein [Caudoviricetes sp.]